MGGRGRGYVFTSRSPFLAPSGMLCSDKHQYTRAMGHFLYVALRLYIHESRKGVPEGTSSIEKNQLGKFVKQKEMVPGGPKRKKAPSKPVNAIKKEPVVIFITAGSSSLLSEAIFSAPDRCLFQTSHKSRSPYPPNTPRRPRGFWAAWGSGGTYGAG